MTPIWCKGHLLVTVHFEPTNYIGWIWKTTFQQCNHWLSSQVKFYRQVPLICILLQQHWCDHLAERQKALLILLKHKSITSGWRSSTCWGEVGEAFFEGGFFLSSFVQLLRFPVESAPTRLQVWRLPATLNVGPLWLVVSRCPTARRREDWALRNVHADNGISVKRQRILIFSGKTTDADLFWSSRINPPVPFSQKNCNLLHAISPTLLCTGFTTAKGCTFSWFLTPCLVRLEKDVVQNIKHMFVWRDLWLPENLRGVFWWPSAHFSSSSLWRWIWVKLAGKFCSLSPYS